VETDRERTLQSWARRTLVPPRPDLLAAKFRAKRESGKVDFRPAVGKGSAKPQDAGLAILAGQDTSLADVILRKVAFEDHVRASVRTASPAAGHRKLPADPRTHRGGKSA